MIPLLFHGIIFDRSIKNKRAFRLRQSPCEKNINMCLGNISKNSFEIKNVGQAISLISCDTAIQISKDKYQVNKLSVDQIRRF